MTFCLITNKFIISTKKSCFCPPLAVYEDAYFIQIYGYQFIKTKRIAWLCFLQNQRVYRNTLFSFLKLAYLVAQAHYFCITFIIIFFGNIAFGVKNEDLH